MVFGYFGGLLISRYLLLFIPQNYPQAGVVSVQSLALLFPCRPPHTVGVVDHF